MNIKNKKMQCLMGNEHLTLTFVSSKLGKFKNFLQTCGISPGITEYQPSCFAFEKAQVSTNFPSCNW